MPRFLAGALAALLLVVGGVWLWQAQANRSAPPALAAPPPPPTTELPGEGDPEAEGTAPPEPLSAPQATREERRFNRYDRDRDGLVTRTEMMSTRTKAFQKLDRDHNNLLSFEEWAVATSDRFGAADGNRDGRLTRLEFAATAPKRKSPARCDCAR